MSKFVVDLDLGNAAFVVGAEPEADVNMLEVATCLRQVAQKVLQGEREGVVWGSNGNKVGSFGVVDD